MSSSLQNFPSIFAPSLPPPQSSPSGLIAEQPTSRGPTTDNKSSQAPQPDHGTFHDALKRAAEHDKHDKHGPKRAAKPAKTATKPPPSPEKSGRAAHKQRGTVTDSSDVNSNSAHITGKGPNPDPAAASPAPSEAPADPSVNQPHPGAPRPRELHGEPAASPKPPPTPPAQRATAKAAAESPTQGHNLDQKPAATKVSVRPVSQSTEVGATSADPAKAPDNAHSNDAKPAQLTAEVNPGSAIALAGSTGAAGQPAVNNRGPAAVSPPDTSGSIDASSVSTTGAAPTGAAAVLGFLDELASVAENPATNAAPVEKEAAKPADPATSGSTPFSNALEAAGSKGRSPGPLAPDAPAQPAPETRFAEANNAKIVTGVRGELLPNGGAMHLRLDPPELGDLQISVHLRDGVMTADFQTSNDQATRLLSHSLGNLKSMLEAQGVSVDKLHVQQGPKSNAGDSQGSPGGANREPTPEQRQSDRRDQQRKEMIQKMWDKVAGKAPVDVVA